MKLRQVGATSSECRTLATNRRRSARRGAAAVEFAFVAPLIFLLFFASVEFGRLFMVLHGLEAAAREGCRVAISWDTTQEDIESIVADRLKSFGVSGFTLTSDPDPARTACQFQPITVRVAVKYEQVSWLPVARYLKGITLTSSCTLPQESDQCQ